MSDIDRVDHAIIVTLAPLQELAATYTALGFTVTPQSRHAANTRPGEPSVLMGTANHCIVFAENYLELLGIVDPDGGDQWGVRRMAAVHEGLRGQVFGCFDPAAVNRRLSAAGVATSGVLTLERDVETPGGTATMRAEVIRLDLEGAPEGGLAIGAQEDRSVIHQPAYTTHANGALALAGITLVVADEEVDHYLARYRTLLDVTERADGPRWTFPLRVGRVEIVPVSAMDTVLPGESAPVLPYVAAQTITVADLGAARSVIEGNGIPVHPMQDGFLVRAADTRGANTIFTEQR